MLKDKVHEWIKKTGFPLEMETASAFRTAGFEVRQSFTYTDPQSEKGREIDVLARDPDWMGVIEIFFVFECKASSKPWVVLTSEDALDNYNRLSAFAITSGEAKTVLSENSIKDDQLVTYLQRSSRSGYGFRQAFGKNDDTAYSAAIGVLKACHGLAKDREATKIPRYAFAFPVIVVDSAIFECSFGTDGELNLIEVEESEFLFSAYIPGEVGCCIKVIKKERLTEFARYSKELSETIRQDFKEKEKMALKQESGT